MRFDRTCSLTTSRSLIMAHRLLLLLGLLLGATLAFPAPETRNMVATPIPQRWLSPVPQTQIMPTPTKITTSETAITTIAPLLKIHALRQKCWNDQGFSVDCAAWTGYRYTWGPPGNPYAGGPGQGGGGSGSGGTTVVVSRGNPCTSSCIQWKLMVLCTLLIWCLA